MLIAQNCTKVLTFVTHRKLAFHMPQHEPLASPSDSRLTWLAICSTI